MNKRICMQAFAVAAITLVGMQSLAAQQPAGTVLYIVPTLDDEFYLGELEAAREEAKNYPNIEFEFTAGTGRDSIPELISKIEAGVVRQVDVIVIDAASGPERLAPALRRAMEAGVKVVANAMPIPGLDPDAKTEYSQREGAIPAGRFMAEQLMAGDEIAVIRCNEGNVALDERYNGFMEGLDGSGIDVVVKGDAYCDPLQARAMMENWITAYPNLKGVFSDTDIALVGAVEALKAANLDPVVVGHDGQEPVLRMLARGEIVDATVYFSSRPFGELGVQTAVRLLDGEVLPDVIMLPPQGFVTQDNVQEYLER